MDAILVLMQVGQNNDWTDRGLPEVVTDFGRASTPADGGIEWLIDKRPDAESHWRLLVWELTDQPYKRDKPDAIVTPEEFRVAAGKRRSNRSQVRRRAARLAVPTGRVVRKSPAGDDLLGQTILITQDRSNNSAPQATGPWYVAAAPGRDAVAARVYRVATVERGDTVNVQLITKVGAVGPLPMGHGVIPLEEA